MAHSTSAIANYFLSIANGLGESITPMKLQKLVYFAHGWNLAINKQPLIEENIEAWSYGPVIPSLYHEFKNFSRFPIEGFATELDDDLDLVIPIVPAEDKKTTKLLDKIWKVYGKFSATSLSNHTHKKNTPWDIIRNENDHNNAVIPNALIEDYFTKLVQKNKDKEKEKEKAEAEL